jgi:hypothetical protein
MDGQLDVRKQLSAEIDNSMAKIDRKAEEARQRFKAHLKPMFPTIVTVHSVHAGPNRAQRRAWKKARKA